VLNTDWAAVCSPHELIACPRTRNNFVHLRLGERFLIVASHEVCIADDVPWAWQSAMSAAGLNVAGKNLSVPANGPHWFSAGWIGFLTYEAGLSIEGITPTTRDDVPIPPSRFGLYDTVAIFDHQEQSWALCAVEWPEGMFDDRPSARERLERLRSVLAERSETTMEPASSRCEPGVQGGTLTESGPRELKFATRSVKPSSRRLKPAAREDGRFETSPLVPNMSREEYLRRVERAKRYIEAGDVYQVNLSIRFSAKTTGSPQQLYQRLCKVNPAAYSAFIQWGDTAIISASPELFLELRDGRVVTRPIKGTRPRTGDPAIDAAARRELETSEKERAELNMIVDLLRNDLGRVCEFGSVRVTDAGSIEELPTVLHRVATIEGLLAEGKTASDLLRATFPGGSITGAPKIRAMQIIDELEPTARGVYCGSIGWIGLDGSMSMNIAIRTMVQVGDTVHLYAGSGIVADSDPQQEYEEIMAKAGGMIRALGTQVEVATK
jgi:para-aminobenzoate synthetase component I